MSQRSSDGDALVGRHAAPPVADRRVDVTVAAALRDARGPRDREHAGERPALLARHADRPVAEAALAVAGGAVAVVLRAAVLERRERHRRAGSRARPARRRRSDPSRAASSVPTGHGALGRRERLDAGRRSATSRTPAPPSAASSAGTTCPTTAPSSPTVVVSSERGAARRSSREQRRALRFDKADLRRVVRAQQAVDLGDVALRQRTASPNSSAEKRGL